MMSKVDFFGHFFYASLFLGMLLLSAKDYRGWAFRFAGEVGWIGIGLVMGMSSIVVWGVAFMAIDVWGYLKWQAEQAELEKEERLEDATDEWPETDFDRDDFVLDYIQKVKTNAEQKLPRRVRPATGKPKAKTKRNPAPKRQGERKKVAAKRSRPANRKVRTGGRRPRK